MTDIAKLRELLARIESATGPDREIDYAIISTLSPETAKEFDSFWEYMNSPFCHRNYTSSIDAAVALCKRVLPGWRGHISYGDFTHGGCWIANDHHMVANIEAKTPSLALCAAVLRAKIALLEKAAETLL